MDATLYWVRRLLEAIHVLPNGVKVSPEEMFSRELVHIGAGVYRAGDVTYVAGSNGDFKEYRPSLPTDHTARKKTPMCRGLLDYFPLACAEVARLSMAANEQHNPGEPMHWAREKSTDHADCIVRHLVDRGKLDKDGMRHSAKVAWRALAMLQLELEQK